MSGLTLRPCQVVIMC